MSNGKTQNNKITVSQIIKWILILILLILFVISMLTTTCPCGKHMQEYFDKFKHIQAYSHSIKEPETDIFKGINITSGGATFTERELLNDYLNNNENGLKQCSILFNEKNIKHFEKLNKNNNVIEEYPCIEMIKYYTENAPVQINRITDMKVARIAPKTITLEDGKILIIGGEGKGVDSVELFNPKTNKFTLLSDDISQYYQTSKRHFFDEPYTTYNLEKAFYTEPILLPDGRVYYLGAVYNPKTYQFSKANSLLAKNILEKEKQLSSKEVVDKDVFKPFEVFKDGKILSLKCSDDFRNCTEILLEDITNNTLYHPGIFNESNDYPYFDAAINSNNDIIIWKAFNNYSYSPLKGTIRHLDYENKYIHGVFEVSFINKDQLFIIAQNLDNQIYGYLYSLKENKILQKYKLPDNVSYNYLNTYFLGHEYLPKLVKKTAKKLNSKLIAIKSGHLMIIINLENNDKYTIYNSNISPWQPLIKLDDERYLILGGSEYNYKDVNEFNMKPGKFAAILTVKK